MATLKEDAMIVAGIGLGVVLIAWYMKSKVSDAINTVPEIVADAWAASVDATKFVNPTSPENVFYRVQDTTYKWMTGSKGSIGTDFYDATHGGILSDGTFNPTSDNNFIYKGVSELFGGDLGTKIYDWFH